MSVTKQENGMHIRINEFVWGDQRGYAYNEYMLISGMLVTGVFCIYNSPFRLLGQITDLQAELTLAQMVHQGQADRERKPAPCFVPDITV